jgi:hypothetical protein
MGYEGSSVAKGDEIEEFKDVAIFSKSAAVHATQCLVEQSVRAHCTGMPASFALHANSNAGQLGAGKVRPRIPKLQAQT